MCIQCVLMRIGCVHTAKLTLNFSLQGSHVVQCQVALLLLWAYTHGFEEAYSTARVERKMVSLNIVRLRCTCVGSHDYANPFKLDSNHLVRWNEIKTGLAQSTFSVNACALIQIEWAWSMQCEL